jgi:hypothetical protein
MKLAMINTETAGEWQKSGGFAHLVVVHCAAMCQYRAITFTVDS